MFPKYCEKKNPPVNLKPMDEHFHNYVNLHININLYIYFHSVAFSVLHFFILNEKQNRYFNNILKHTVKINNIFKINDNEFILKEQFNKKRFVSVSPISDIKWQASQCCLSSAPHPHPHPVPHELSD